MKLVLASKNQKKLVEMNEILSHLGIQVCSEAELTYYCFSPEKSASDFYFRGCRLEEEEEPVQDK